MSDQSNEQIFDSLLEEMLTNQHPPDLTDIIQQRARQEFGTSSLLNRTATVTSSNAKRLSVAMWSSLAIAATLLIAVGAWRLLPSNTPNLSGKKNDVPVAGTTELAQSHKPAKPDGKAQESMPASTDDNRTSESAVARATAGSGTGTRIGTELPLDNLPFNRSDKPDPGTGTNVAQNQPTANAWKDEAVVTWLDNQFANLWKKQMISEPQMAQTSVLIDRLNDVLTARQAVVVEQAPAELARRLVHTATFAESMADRVVSFWLRNTAYANPKHNAHQELRNFIAQRIVAGTPWNEVLAGLIGGKEKQASKLFLTSLAGGDNHRLTARVSSAFFDEALACARCHDASDNGKVISTEQDDYWSLVVMFNGLDVQIEDPKTGKNTRELVDHQDKLFRGDASPTVFFDRPDGRLQTARVRLPNGDNWRSVEGAKTPREALALWMAQSTATDQAAVNLAWRFVFKRPLVAEHAALDGEGYEDRREILRTLAVQFAAHGRNMPQLVEWLVASKPFRASELDVDRQRSLLASEGELVAWNRATTNFATFVPRSVQSTRTTTLDTSLASVIRWSGSADASRSTLAQPVAPSNTKRPVQDKASSKADDEASSYYLVRSTSADKLQSDFVARLVASKLTWKQQVDHIAGLVGESAGNANLHRLADQLLESKNGDSAAALTLLLQSARLCHESL